MTIVVERIRWVRRAFNAGDGAQVLINCLQIMVRHILKRGPRHDLQLRAIERKWNAVRRNVQRARSCVLLIEVDPRSDDLQELRKRAVFGLFTKRIE